MTDTRQQDVGLLRIESPDYSLLGLLSANGAS